MITGYFFRLFLIVTDII